MTGPYTDCGDAQGAASEGARGQWRHTRAWRIAKRVIVSIAGAALIGLGVVTIFTPGPAMVLIPAGLAVLAIEYTWAKSILRWFKKTVVKIAGKVGGPKVARQIDRGVGWVQRKLHVDLDEEDENQQTRHRRRRSSRPAQQP